MNKIRGVLFDIDGTLAFQGKVYPGAIEAIEKLRQLGISLMFLTNSTLNSRQSSAARLGKSGIHVFPEEVITASYATARYLERHGIQSCWIMLEGAGLDEFKGLRQDTENPEYIVVGDNRSMFDFNHLNKVLRLLLKGAKLIGMHSDLLDTSTGTPELNVGAWVRMLETASGVRADIIGKPFPFVFELALAGISLNKDQLLMVGDRVQTDIQGARQFGIKAALVKTGEFKYEDLNFFQPDFILDGVQDVVKLVM